MLLGGGFLEVLSFFCNRMDMFLVSGFVMTVMGVCDFVRLIISRLTCNSLFCPLFFIPRGLSCSVPWM